MRLIVFFDLPVETTEERRAYTKFRRYLIQSGYMMMQESVYCKMVLNASSQAQAIDRLRYNRPAKGLVQVLSITEKQYSRMEFIAGEFATDIINSDERLIIL